jgi:hypothetical protein
MISSIVKGLTLPKNKQTIQNKKNGPQVLFSRTFNIQISNLSRNSLVLYRCRGLFMASSPKYSFGRPDWYIQEGWHSQRHSIYERSVKTGALLIAQIHGYLLGLKSIKTFIVGLQKFLINYYFMLVL